MTPTRFSLSQSFTVCAVLILVASCSQFDNNTDMGQDIAGDLDPAVDKPSVGLAGYATVEEISSSRDTLVLSNSVSGLQLLVGRWQNETALSYLDFDTVITLQREYRIDSVHLHLSPEAAADTTSSEEFSLILGTTAAKGEDTLLERNSVDSTRGMTVVFQRDTLNTKKFSEVTLPVDTTWQWYAVRDSIQASSDGSDTTHYTVIDMSELFIALVPAADQDSVIRLSRPSLSIYYHGPLDFDTSRQATKKITVYPPYYDRSIQEDDASGQDGRAVSSRAPRRYLNLRLSLSELLQQALDSSETYDYTSVASATIEMPIDSTSRENPSLDDPLSLVFSLRASDSYAGTLGQTEMTTRKDATTGDTLEVARFDIRADLDTLWNEGAPTIDHEFHFYTRLYDNGVFRNIIWNVQPGDTLPVEFVLSIPR